MAPPLVKGRALARQRLAGVVFLVVLALLVELAVALYQKKFTDTVRVALETDRAGNQLSTHADVKVRGVIVGEVRGITSDGSKAVLDLALDPDKVALVPRDVRAQLLPKTLFGEKEVQLVIPANASSEHLRDGDTISQDRSAAALETEQAFNDLLPVLRSLRPQQLSLTLSALADGLRGRGDQLGRNLQQQGAYFARLNPELPTLARDMRGLADFAETNADAAPDVLRVLDNLAFSGRALVQERADLDTFLQSTRTFAESARSTVADNERRFVDLARDSLPSLQLYASQADRYPCLLNRVAFQEIEGERVFGGDQPGLQITVEVVRDMGPFTATQHEPKYLEKRNFHCYGLGPKPVIPFPAYANPQDGYNDDAPPESPGTGPPPGAVSAQSLVAPTPTSLSRPMPAGTTELDALLLAPVIG